MRVVLKYGGSSVETIEKIKKIAKYIKKLKEKIEEIVVVVSAMGKTTDSLIKEAESIGKNISDREMDMLLSIGEQKSVALLSMALNSIGCEAISFNGYQLGIETFGPHRDSQIKFIDIKKIEKTLKLGKVIIVTGFQGVNSEGDITTLGRGGSDTTAVALAGRLGCECRIYTDVDGVYTEDPRKNSLAQKIDVISYNDMEKMSASGAKVMELRSVRIGREYNVPIFVGKSLGDEKGTWIKE